MTLVLIKIIINIVLFTSIQQDNILEAYTVGTLLQCSNNMLCVVYPNDSTSCYYYQGPYGVSTLSCIAK